MPWSIQRIILKTPYYPFHQFILDLLRAIASSTALSCLRSSSRREDVLFFSLGALAGGGAFGWTLGAGAGWGAALVGDAGAVLAGFFTFLSVFGCAGGGSAGLLAGGASRSADGLFLDTNPPGFSFSTGLLSKVNLMFCFEPTTFNGSLGLEVIGA